MSAMREPKLKSSVSGPPAAASGASGGADVDATASWQRSGEDWDWLTSHPEVLAQHAGRWIISEDDEAAFQQRLEQGAYASRAPLIMRVPTPSEWAEVRVG